MYLHLENTWTTANILPLIKTTMLKKPFHFCNRALAVYEKLTTEAAANIKNPIMKN